MSTFFRSLGSAVMRAGTKAAKVCAAGLRFAVSPVVQLILRAVHKGNRVMARGVYAVRRFLYIARRYGYKRAARSTAYRLEQKLAGYMPPVKTEAIRLAPMVLVVAVLVCSIHWWTAFTLAYEVTYDGSNVGYVNSESVVADACQLVGDRVVEDEFTAKNVTYKLKVVAASTVNDAAEICDNIIEVSEEIKPAVGLYVDGQLLAVCEDGKAIQSAMEQIAASYAKQHQQEKISFANEIEYIGGVYPTQLVTQTVDSARLSSALTVMMTNTQTYNQTIRFDTKEITDPSQYIGYRAIKTRGVDGQKTVVADVSYVNGKEVDRRIVSETVVKQPVTCVVVVGSKPRAGASNTNTGTELFWPVANSDVSDISSYFGDGRNHKGTDILAPNGTAIYAAEDGVVSYVGWESGYGYYMIIEHGNGISTLYSHCSSITAKEGQTVKRGDYVAAVGITGRAYAYHLHFEVRIGGKAVDARPYLGIYN